MWSRRKRAYAHALFAYALRVLRSSPRAATFIDYTRVKKTRRNTCQKSSALDARRRPDASRPASFTIRFFRFLNRKKRRLFGRRLFGRARAVVEPAVVPRHTPGVRPRAPEDVLLHGLEVVEAVAALATRRARADGDVGGGSVRSVKHIALRVPPLITRAPNTPNRRLVVVRVRVRVFVPIPVVA